MKTITTLSVLVLLCVHTSAQFQLRYSTPNYDWPAALDIDLKDGYIIAGQTLSGTWYPSLLRVDANGTPIWSYTYNLPGIDEHFWDVTTAKWYPELLYVAVGNADMEPNASFDGDDYFLMVSAGGTPLYVKRYLTPDTDVAQHIQAIVHPHYGNGFVITGYTYHSQTKDKDIHILLTDKWGGLLKSAVLNTALNQQAYCVEFTKDGGFILTGETQLEKTCDKKDVNVLVIRLDSQLKVLWSKTFDFIPEKGTSDDKAYAGREDSNGEIQLAGTSKFTLMMYMTMTSLFCFT